MSGDKASRPKARLPRGFRDRGAAEIAAERACLDAIRRVYESYGFEALETPAFEFTDALGKFLPDVDRPNEGVFSLQDDDKQWMSLRYDLTAPLARYVAENFQHLPKPFRRYQVGPVWRNEKPGPGRFREFTQFDADTVGSASPSADAELLMMACDALEALGLGGNFVLKINNRKLLDGLLESVGVDLARRAAVLRVIDKLDRLGQAGVFQLLTNGRVDESGDKTDGVGLLPEQAYKILAFITSIFDEAMLRIAEQEGIRRANPSENSQTLDEIERQIGATEIGAAGSAELRNIIRLLENAGYGPDRARIDKTIVRGLDYYTGPVFEAQLTFPVRNEAGQEVIFGSVAGGGRYDDLVARFTGQQVPATGISIGVSRLITAMRSRGMEAKVSPLVVVLALDDLQSSFGMAAELRGAGIRSETYVGTKKFGDQLKYADRRGAVVAIIEGGDERAKGEVTLKDLALGAELSKSVESRADWVKERSAQISVKRADLVSEVQKMLTRGK